MCIRDSFRCHAPVTLFRRLLARATRGGAPRETEPLPRRALGEDFVSDESGEDEIRVFADETTRTNVQTSAIRVVSVSSYGTVRSRSYASAEAHGDVFGSRASRRAGAHRRDVSARVGLSDPGYWEGVTALMTPTVAVDLSPPSLAALAIGGVLVLGHSWESIEASRGWRDGKRGGDAGKKTRKENANASTTNAASLLATPSERERERVTEINTGTPVTQKIMTKAEREAAEASARAARVLAVAAARADAETRAAAAVDGDAPARSDPPRVVARIEVCTNNACAKRGGKEVLSALLLLAETNETRARVECRRSRCMDACASACVVRVNGAGGLQRHAHVGADEAGEIFELATGVVVE